MADWNPLSAVTAAARQPSANPNPSTAIRAWPMQHPVDAALLRSIALVAIFRSPRRPALPASHQQLTTRDVGGVSSRC